MSTSINVNKSTVISFLETGKEKPFLIPEYQRPYAWTVDNVDTLYNDLWDFSLNEGGTKRKSYYFLGSIVFFENEDCAQEIIDGQQRITTLFLLLRAVYTKLKNSQPSKESVHFIGQIEKAIWKSDELTGEVDYSTTLLTSNVVKNDGNKILNDILQTGSAAPKSEDNYSVNYRRVQTLLNESSEKDPMQIYQFIYSILNQAIILPIQADTQDTALTIFSTLNNRGLALSDADIFKAKIYNHLDQGPTRDKFIADWKDLEERASSCSETIQSLFYYYMFYLRASDNISDTTIPGVRNYYLDKKKENLPKLLDENLLPKLDRILNIWTVVRRHENIKNESWSDNVNIIKTLDILSYYANEYWKYPVIIFYLTHYNTADFENCFLKFLRKLVFVLLTKYVEVPGIYPVKSSILKLNVEIIKSIHPKFEFEVVDDNILKEKLKTPHKNALRMLLEVITYNKQNKLLPEKWEIEHILPQNWQPTFFQDMPADYIKEMIEHIGNKIPFEKRLNIIASDGYFDKKKSAYLQSNIEITKTLGNSLDHSWDIESIKKRDIEMSSEILTILNSWNTDY